VRRWLLFDSVSDTTELDELRALVESELRSWPTVLVRPRGWTVVTCSSDQSAVRI
jgi:hypothetical protein